MFGECQCGRPVVTGRNIQIQAFFPSHLGCREYRLERTALVDDLVTAGRCVHIDIGNSKYVRIIEGSRLGIQA